MGVRKLFGFLLLIGALSACLQKQPVEDVPDKLKKITSLW
jgi:outer membrane lipoprotein-sorting protein